jgi:phospholipid/cholesterol/gamma-HCH transport system substrate-binding protein
METKSNGVFVGIVVLLAMLATVISVLWLSQDQFRRDFALYTIAIPGPVRGLSEGGEVRFNGIKVGEVDDLRLDPDAPNVVLADVRVERATPISPDSVISLEFLGLTGLSFVQVQAGSEPPFNTLDLPAGTIPRITATTTQIDMLVASGGDLLTSAGEAILRINTLLSDNNQREFTRLLANLATASEALTEADALVADLRSAAQSLTTATEKLDATMAAWTNLAEVTAKEVEPLAKEMRLLLAQSRTSLERVEGSLAATLKRVDRAVDELSPEANALIGDVGLTVQDMRALTQRLERMLREVERDPRGFIAGESKPTAPSRK